MEQNQSSPFSRTHYIREVSVSYRGPRRAEFKVTQPDDIARFIGRVMPDNSREHFITLHLDGSHRVISYCLTATGTANTCLVHPREVFQSALMIGAVSIVVAHNHPSGEITPSAEDKNVTARLKEAGELLGVTVLDHVILGSSQFYSFTSNQTYSL